MASWLRRILNAVDGLEGSTTAIEAQAAQLVYDSEGGGLQVIDTPHKKLHDGATYHFSRSLAEGAKLADDASMDIWVSVPAGAKGHLIPGYWTAGLAQVYLYEAPTVSDEGTAVTPVNRNRGSLNTPDLIVKHTPTVSNVGTVLINGEWIGVADVPGPILPGSGSSRGTQEWKLEASTSYLLRITARAADLLATIDLDWYE